MKRWEIVLDIKPFGKGRPRFGKGKTFTPRKTRAMENQLRMALLAAQAPMFDGPIRLRAVCCFKKPKSAPKDREYPTVKPDIDNIAKALLDCCNNILFQDDKQVIDLILHKRYSESEKIYLEVSST